jgi:predicted  nucleic acid-binding Zn-ribbon protein
MTDWKKLVREALKDTEGAYDKVISSLETAGIKLQDVSTGDYVSSQKYNDEVTKLNAEITKLKEAPNPLEEEVTKLKESHAADMAAEKAKVEGIIKTQAISKKISELGITNELEVLGIKSLIKMDEIKMDSDYNITSGLDEQIESLKGTYKSSFDAPKLVSTGQSIQTSKKVEVGKVYSSDEIDNMSVEEIMANLDAVNKSLQ